MIVKELKEKLEQFNDNLIVMIPNINFYRDFDAWDNVPATHISQGVNELDGCVFIDDYVEDVAKDIFIEPIELTMTNEEVEEVIERCRRRVVEELGSTDL